MSQSLCTVDTANFTDLPPLFEVWESSVRATHSFLSEDDIQLLGPLVKAELSSFSPIHYLRNKDGEAFAFLGVAGSKIEMLFVHAAHRGTGAGRLLSEFAIRVLAMGGIAVDVGFVVFIIGRFK